MAGKPKANENGPDNPGAFVSHIPKYQTETACRQFLEQQRYWPKGHVCAHCKGTKAYKLNDKKYGIYKCASCHKRFSITTKTVFEGTHIRSGSGSSRPTRSLRRDPRVVFKRSTGTNSTRLMGRPPSPRIRTQLSRGAGAGRAGTGRDHRPNPRVGAPSLTGLTPI